MDDREAVHRMKNGELGGLEILVKRYQLKAVRTAFFITHDESLAEDIVQDTFIRFYQRSHHIDEGRPFKPYLMRSVVNAALNMLRRGKNSVSLDADPAILEALLERTSSVESQVELTQLSHEILQALSKLSPRQRAVIVQRHYLEMSEQEMARSRLMGNGSSSLTAYLRE